MKKTVSLLLSFVMLLGLLTGTALAAGTTTFHIAFVEEGSGQKRTLSVKVSMPDSDTMEATVTASSEDEDYIGSYLATDPVTLSLPCDEPWEFASITIGGQPGRTERVYYDEDTSCYYIDFDVALLGTYVITNTTPSSDPEPSPTPDPGPAPDSGSSGPSGGGASAPAAPAVPGGAGSVPSVNTSAPVASSETKENADGSATKTETLTNGTVVETTKNTDGSSVTTATKTETKETAGGKVTTTTSVTTTTDPSGAAVKESVEEVVTESAEGKTTSTTLVTQSKDKAEKTVTESKTTVDETGKEVTVTTTKTETAMADGSKGTTTVGEDGKVEAKTELSRAALEAAKKAEAPVALPMPALEVSAGDETAAVVTVNLPYGTKSAAVAIPVTEGTGEGAVAVIVNADGTETVLTESVVTAGGLVANVPAGATVKVVDNSATFSDVTDSDWEKDAVDFTSARNIMNGTGEAFSPDAVTTRAMVWTMLARLEGVDTAAGENWWDAGRKWAMENEISDGTNAEGEITREQLATMLYRYMGEPAHDHEIGHFDDHHETSDWARAGKEWAVGNKVINGKGNADGTLSLDPTGDASRAEVAQMFMNFIKNVKI